MIQQVASKQLLLIQPVFHLEQLKLPESSAAEAEATLFSLLADMDPHAALATTLQEFGKKKMRTIFDSRWLNSILHDWRYRYAAVTDVIPAVEPGCLFSSADVSSCFYHLRVHPAAKCLLGFQVGDQYYCWNRLPFGLSLAPAIISALMAEILSGVMADPLIRRHCLAAVVYIDDFLFVWQEGTPQSVWLHCLTLLRGYGLDIHPEKSSAKLLPSVIFLGLSLSEHSGQLIIQLPEARRQALLLHIAALGELLAMAQPTAPLQQRTIRQVKAVAGKLQWASQAVPAGKAHLYGLYWLLTEAEVIGLSALQAAIECLRAWKEALGGATPMTRGVKGPAGLIAQSGALVLATDAAVSDGLGSHGGVALWWQPRRSLREIHRWKGEPLGLVASTQEAELAGICHGLHWALSYALSADSPGQLVVAVLCDAQSAVAAVARGYSRSYSSAGNLRLVTTLGECAGRLLVLPCWLPRGYNTLADSLSRC